MYICKIQKATQNLITVFKFILTLKLKFTSTPMSHKWLNVEQSFWSGALSLFGVDC